MSYVKDKGSRPPESPELQKWWLNSSLLEGTLIKEGPACQNGLLNGSSISRKKKSEREKKYEIKKWVKTEGYKSVLPTLKVAKHLRIVYP